MKEISIEIKNNNGNYIADVFIYEDGKIVNDYSFEFKTNYEIESFIELLKLADLKVEIEKEIHD
jgi:hypothetical protein